MEEQQSSKAKVLAFILGSAAFAIAPVYANGLMVSEQSLVLVVLAIAVVAGVVAASIERGGVNSLPLLWFLLVVNYFFVRAMSSPVRDLANEDMVLISVAALTFFIFGGLRGGGRWLLAVLIGLAAVHVGVAWMQKFSLLPAHHTGRVMGLF